MTLSRHRRAIALGIGMLPFAGLPALGIAAPVGPALDRPSMPARRPERAVLLGAALSGRRVVAVGERGIVVTSDDQGEVWHQSPTPTSVTLTAVRFANAEVGFAVGHGGTVLISTDAGLSWSRKLDGRRIAQFELDDAQRRDDAAALKTAQRMVAEGPDKPLLDLLVLDARRAVAVGAYGMAVQTHDGGLTWASFRQRLDNPKELHLYTARARGQRVLLAGEQGLVLLSTDGGQSFTRMVTPYKGSFFTSELPDDRTILLAGLRGNVWQSTDGGASWKQLATPMPATITSSLVDAQGRVLFANQAGVVLALADGQLAPLTVRAMPPLNFLLALDDGQALALTVDGALTVPLPGQSRKGVRP